MDKSAAGASTFPWEPASITPSWRPFGVIDRRRSRLTGTAVILPKSDHRPARLNKTAWQLCPLEELLDAPSRNGRRLWHAGSQGLLSAFADVLPRREVSARVLQSGSDEAAGLHP